MKNKQIFFLLLTRVVLINLLVLLLFSCSTKNKPGTHDEGYYYTCPMDPQVVEAIPGKCPICKMDLTKVKKSNSKPGTLQLSQDQIKLGNIKTEVLGYHEIGNDLYLTGMVVPDQRYVTTISSRVEGRIEKLYFKNVGEQVKAGQVIYEIYSEELVSLQQEYLLAIKKQQIIQDNDINYKTLTEASKNKLLLLGLSENQIINLENSGEVKANYPVASKVSGTITKIPGEEGEYIMEGTPILEIADFTTLWIETQIYTGEAPNIYENDWVQVIFPAFPEKKIAGKITFINPEVNQQSKIDLIRIEIVNNSGDYKPGMQANVYNVNGIKKALVTFTNAIQVDASGSKAWVKTSQQTFELRKIETGFSNKDRIEIKSGLKAGDQVVVSGAYLLSSEYKFKNGSNAMAGNNHGM